MISLSLREITQQSVKAGARKITRRELQELRRQREERLAQREAERLERAPERKSAAKVGLETPFGRAWLPRKRKGLPVGYS